MSRPYVKRQGGVFDRFRGNQNNGSGNPHNQRSGPHCINNIKTSTVYSNNQPVSKFQPRGGRQAGGGRANNGNNSNKGGNNGGGGSANADLMKTLLKLLFEKSHQQVFNEENGMLILNNMRTCDDLAAVQKSVDFNSVSFCNVLGEVLRDTFANRIRVLQVDGNDIRRLGILLASIAAVNLHHGIIAISARDNELSDFSFMGPLKSYDSLSELLLLGNKVTSTKDYRVQITMQLKQLKMLDGEVIQRNLLTLPNPIPTAPPEAQVMNVLLYAEQNLFAALNARSFDHMNQVYGPSACFSVAQINNPLPQRVPRDANHRTADLNQQMRESLQAEVSTARNSIYWRNLVGDIQSIRNISFGREKVICKLQAVCGKRPSLHIRHELNPNANVSFVEVGMKVPLCIVTIHGKARYVWNPVDSQTQQPMFVLGKEPFCPLFFHRTLALTWDGATQQWMISNDMLLMRRDFAIVHDDGTPTEPLYFANSAPRVERLRRQLLPNAAADVMAALVTSALSDDQIREMAQHIQNMLPEQQQKTLSSPEQLRQALGIQC